MEPPPPKPSTSQLFEVYLRLRPSPAASNARFLDVEEGGGERTHITIKPPSNDHRKRAVERFAFTKVFEEEASQLDVFRGTGVVPLIEGVLGREGREGRDGLLATLGVTGSGKSHTILGTKSQRGLTQLALDALFQATRDRLVQPNAHHVFPSLAAADVSEAQLFPASLFLDMIYGDGTQERGAGPNSRAQTPMMDNTTTSFLSIASTRTHRAPPRPQNFPTTPALPEDLVSPADPTAEYAIVVSMYEVYNDRIFDLLTGSTSISKLAANKRRALLFKSTEGSSKVVAGLRKVVCGSLDEALAVLETGLLERKVAGTGANAVSSRSHGFFCVEVKKRVRGSGGSSAGGPWSSSTLTIVDLAGSERARTAKTTGSTLAEAGKINESLMYLGQCMQLVSDMDPTNPRSGTVVPFRQCKLTELLFSNSFPTSSTSTTTSSTSGGGRTTPARPAQKAIMLVTADARGDFNATSQILRYSALAREVTVPRVPSVTQAILAGPGTRVPSASAARSPTPTQSQLQQQQQQQLLTDELTTELATLRHQLAGERERRRQAEASWAAALARLTDVEAEVEAAVRAEVAAEVDSLLDRERRRWHARWVEECGRAEAFWDRKADLLVSAVEGGAETGVEVEVFEDGNGKEEVEVEGLRRENEELRRRLERLEREGLNGGTPTRTVSGRMGGKVRVLKARKWAAVDEEGVSKGMGGLGLDDSEG